MSSHDDDAKMMRISQVKKNKSSGIAVSANGGGKGKAATFLRSCNNRNDDDEGR